MLATLNALVPSTARAAPLRARRALATPSSCVAVSPKRAHAPCVLAPARAARIKTRTRALNKLVVATATRPSSHAASSMTNSDSLMTDLVHNPVLSGGVLMATVAALALMNPQLHHAVTAMVPTILGIAPPAMDMAATAMLMLASLQAGLAAVDVHYAKTGVTRLNMENATLKHGVCAAMLLAASVMRINTEPFTLFSATFFGMLAAWAYKAAAAMGGAAPGMGTFAFNALTMEGMAAGALGFTMMFTQMDMLTLMLRPLGMTAPAIAVAAPWDVLVPTLLMGLGASRMHAGMHAPARRDFMNAAMSSGVMTAIMMAMIMMGRATMEAMMGVMLVPAIMAAWAFVSASGMRQ